MHIIAPRLRLLTENDAGALPLAASVTGGLIAQRRRLINKALRSMTLAPAAAPQQQGAKAARSPLSSAL